MINNGPWEVAPLGSFPGWYTQTGLRADLRSTWPQGVTERAMVRLVIAHRYGHEHYYAGLAISGRALGQLCSSGVQQPQRTIPALCDRHGPLICVNDLYRPSCP
jgi:hypothetical protein